MTIAWTQGVQDHISLIDTGFTGELKMSEEKAKEIGLKVTHTQPVTLADSSIRVMSASIALVSLEGVTNLVNVLISPGDTIIGVGLLKKFQYLLNIDFKFNQLSLQKL